MDAKTEIKQKIREIWEGDPKFPRGKTADKFGVHRRTIAKWIESFKKELTNAKPNVNTKKAAPRKSFQRGGGIDNFLQKFDDSVIIPRAIQEGVEKYLTTADGSPDWMHDKDFREACGVPHAKWRRYADDFKYLQVKKGDLHCWGHPDIVETMRMAVNR